MNFAKVDYNNSTSTTNTCNEEKIMPFHGKCENEPKELTFMQTFDDAYNNSLHALRMAQRINEALFGSKTTDEPKDNASCFMDAMNNHALVTLRLCDELSLLIQRLGL